MKKTLDTFKQQQEKSLVLLKKLESFLSQGRDLDIPVDQDIYRKLQNAINTLDGEKLKVALIGGFSEGKTSIAAAWMGRLDRATMKISHQESSNEVKIYDLGDDLTLIDTPGLFGFKEQENLATHELEKYKDITKKYVSEAHLILYVMNSTNPVKESHKDDLTWLFRSLNLLPRTVFVLSRFDEVADVEDDKEYHEALSIKKANVIGRLTDLIHLDAKEVAELAIVGISANPFDLGTDYWLSNIEKFQSLSHISSLQDVTSEKISANGGVELIIEETKNTIIRDILHKQLPIAIANHQRISTEVTKLEAANNYLQKQLDSAVHEVNDVRCHLRNFIVTYFSGLILQVKGISIETFGEFFEREIGSNGIVINNKIQNEFERQTKSIKQSINGIARSYIDEVQHYQSAVDQLSRQGMGYVLKSNVISKSTVLLARDGIAQAANLVGLDLGKLLKFQPWGATKLANGLNGVLAFAGLALELWDSWQEAKKNEQFQIAVLKMKADLEQQREELLGLINGDNFIQDFFPSFINLQKNIDDVRKEVIARKVEQTKFHDWRKEGESIDVEFNMV